MGIAKNDQDKLFTKFFRGNSARLAYTEGIGIGLFMSKEIISKQHGKIWVESEGENKGATFFFSLPLAE
jgi:signal transduction histidine kinase